MSAANNLAAIEEALKRQSDKLNEIVTVETLMATAGAAATAAYLQQLTVVKNVTEAQQKAAAAAEAEATARAKAAATAKEAAKAAKEAEKERQQWARDTGRAVSTAFAQASTFAMSMAEQANPTAWSTLQDSLGLVSMQLGKAFLPTIMKVAVYAQDFARWLHDLSPEAKELMTYVAGAGAALYVFGKGLSFVNTMALGIPGKIMDKVGDQLVGSLVSSGVGAKLASGLGAVIPMALGVAAAAGIVTHEFNRMAEAVKQTDESLNKSLDQADKPLEEKMSRSEFEESDIYKKMKAATPEQRKELLSDIQRESMKEIDEANKRKEEGVGKANSYVRRSASFLTHGYLGGVEEAQQDVRKAGDDIAAARQRGQVAMAAAREFGMPGGKFTPTGGAEKMQTAARKKAEQAATFLAHMPKEMQPRFSAVEEARKNLQLGALKDPLEQQKLQWERENNEALTEHIPQLLEHIRGNTKNPGGAP